MLPGDVSAVVHTHLHADHVGWNVDLSGDTPIPNFPNARYYAPSLDWHHFTHPDVLETAPQVKENVIPLHEMGLLELIEGEHAVTEEITTLPAPGHTPGHQVIAVTSGGETALISGRYAARQGADRERRTGARASTRTRPQAPPAGRPYWPALSARDFWSRRVTSIPE